MGAIEEEVKERPPSTTTHHGACTPSPSKDAIDVDGGNYFTDNVRTSPEKCEVVLRSVRDLEAELGVLREYYANQARRVTELERKAQKQEAQMKHQEAVAAGLFKRRRERMVDTTNHGGGAARHDENIYGGAAHFAVSEQARQGMEVETNKGGSPLTVQHDSRGTQSTTGATPTRAIEPTLVPTRNLSSTPKAVEIHPAESFDNPQPANGVTSTTWSGMDVIVASVSDSGVWDTDTANARCASRDKKGSGGVATTFNRAERASLPFVDSAPSAMVPPITPPQLAVIRCSSPATLEYYGSRSQPPPDATPPHTGNSEAKGKTSHQAKKRNERETPRTKRLQSLRRNRADCVGNFARDLGIADRLRGSAERPIVSTVRPATGETSEAPVTSGSQSGWALLLLLGEVAGEFS